MTVVGAPEATATSATARDYVALTKPGVSFMVMVTTAAGYVLAAPGRIDAGILILAVAATGLAAGGSSALNMVVERELDARMRRTVKRPIAGGRLTPTQGLAAGVGLSSIGLLALLFGVGTTPALLCAATLGSYVFLYTPLKTRTSLCTVVGAVPGAIPPLIGWAAAGRELTAAAWVLFAIVFLWQIPHFLAIAWKYREDYARGGFMMLPVVEPDGGSTSRQTVAYTAALLLTALLPVPLRIAGPVYFAGALLGSLAFFGFAVRFALQRSDASARHLFLTSLVYLPVIFGLMLFDRIPPP